MSERERWIVYPLLFLALGAALRDKLSEQTRTKRIECQELIVSSEDGAGQESVPLVRIGAVPRTSANSPHVGEISIKGQLAAEVIQAEGIQARSINADNYFYHRIPFAPTLLRAVPGVSPAGWLRALQQSADAIGAGSRAQRAAGSGRCPIAAASRTCGRNPACRVMPLVKQRQPLVSLDPKR